MFGLFAATWVIAVDYEVLGLASVNFQAFFALCFF